MVNCLMFFVTKKNSELSDLNNIMDKVIAVIRSMDILSIST